MKNNFVYLILNKINRKKYIGVKSTDLDPYEVIGKTYFSSSSDKEFIREQKEHPENFKYRVLKNFKTRKEAVQLECELHERYDVSLNDEFYNKAKQTSTGFDTSGIKLTEEQKEIKRLKNIERYKDINERIKISIKSKESWSKNPQRRLKLIEMNKNRIRTAEEIEKIKQTRKDPITGKDKYSGKNSSFYGKTHTSEYKEKMRLLQTGKTLSQESKDKISKANRGRKHTEEAKIKMSISRKGKKKPEGFGTKISVASKGRKYPDSFREKLSIISKNRLKDNYCKYCGRYFTAQAFGQYHGDKCKCKRSEYDATKETDSMNSVVLNFDDYLNVLSNQELNEEIDFNDEIISIEEIDPVEMIDISLDGNNVFYGNDILIHNCAIGKTDADNSMVSDSIGTNCTADFMLFCLQSEEMKKNCEMVMKVTKNRYTGITDTFMMNINYPKMRFSDIIENQSLPENGTINFSTPSQAVQATNYANDEVRQIVQDDMKKIKEHDSKIEKQKDELLDLLGL